MELPNGGSVEDQGRNREHHGPDVHPQERRLCGRVAVARRQTRHGRVPDEIASVPPDMSALNGAAIRGRSAINHAFAVDRRRATTCGPYAIASTRWSLVARRRLRRAHGQVAACASTVISVDRIVHPFA